MPPASVRPEREPRAIRIARDVHLNVLLLASRSLDQLEELCKAHGITHSQYVALWTLCLTEDPDAGLPVSTVADGLLNRASDATRLIDRLEKAGLAERLPNPQDRRGVLVRATREGRKRFAKVTPDLQAFHATQWSHLSAPEIDELHRLLGTALWGTDHQPPTD